MIQSHANLGGADLRRTKKFPKKFQSNLNILKFQNKLKVFKYLSKNLISPFQDFEYELGKIYISKKADEDERKLCGSGFNFATLEWCILHKGPNDIIVEFEVCGKDLVIPYNTDGKFRTKNGAKVKCVRVVPEKKYRHLLEQESEG